MISGNNVKRTPWEEFLFGAVAPIAGVPTEVKLDEALIFDAANARDLSAEDTSRMGVGRHARRRWQNTWAS